MPCKIVCSTRDVYNRGISGSTSPCEVKHASAWSMFILPLAQHGRPRVNDTWLRMCQCRIQSCGMGCFSGRVGSHQRWHMATSKQIFFDLVNKLLDWNKLFRKRIYHQKLNLCTGPDLSFLSSYSSTSWMYHNQRYLNGYLRWNSTKFYNFEHTLKTDHFCSPIKTKLYDAGKLESHLDKVQFSDHALVLNLFICF